MCDEINLWPGANGSSAQASLQGTDSNTTCSRVNGCSSGKAETLSPLACVCFIWVNTSYMQPPSQTTHLSVRLIPLSVSQSRILTEGVFRIPSIRVTTLRKHIETLWMEVIRLRFLLHHSKSLYSIYLKAYIQRPSGACNIDVGLAAAQTKHLTLAWRSFSCSAGKSNCLLLYSSISSSSNPVCPFPLQTSACYSAICPAVFTLLSSPCVWPGWLASAFIPSLPPLPWRWTLLWVVPHCCPAHPLVHSAELSWLISVSLTPSQLNISNENSPLSFTIYLFLSISISHQTNACAHTALKMCWFRYFPLSCSKHLT